MLAELHRCAGGADRFAVVDTETTGIYSTDRVVEIAIVTLALDGEVIDRFDTLVNPCREVSASHIHGVTASMVADAPTFEEVAGDVAVRLHGACLVGHNVPFDRRMLTNEFDRLGDALVAPQAVDTYYGSGFRLSEACAVYQVDLAGAHRALHDAVATAQLFLQLRSVCGEGAPAAAPVSFPRSGRVRRREDAAPVRLPDAPLITYLASRLPFDGLAVRSQQYLEVVGRAVDDLHLDREERAELTAFSAELGLSDAQVAQAHRRFVNELIDAAIDDHVVTDDEYDTLIRVAAALDVDQDNVEHRIAAFRSSARSARIEPGTQVVFTGDHPMHERHRLEAFARELGLVPHRAVTKSTGILFAVDVQSRSGKAAKAHRYGIPVVSVDDFLAARIGDELGAIGSLGALKVITCPDCHATWTAPAVSGVQSTKRCADCSTITPVSGTARSATSPAVPPTGWSAPVVEWLTCRACTTLWAREVTRGRKPHYCPECAGREQTPDPPGVAKTV